jgi:hypothetical protein
MPVGCPPERRWCVLGPELGPTPFINDTQPASTGAASIVVLSRPAARSHEVPVLSASGPCPRDNDCLYGKADAKGLRRLNDTSMTVTAAIDTACQERFGNRPRLWHECLETQNFYDDSCGDSDFAVQSPCPLYPRRRTIADIMRVCVTEGAS